MFNEGRYNLPDRIQIGSHFELAVGQECPDELTIRKAQDAGFLLRVIGPETIFTMDCRPDRVNVDVDAHNTIQKLTFG